MMIFERVRTAITKERVPRRGGPMVEGAEESERRAVQMLS
jgi:hypothetical protein